ERNRPQNTSPSTGPHVKAQTLDKTPGTLGANASNTGMTIDLPSTVETTAATPVATTSDAPHVSPAASQELTSPEPGGAGALLRDVKGRVAESYAHVAQSADTLGHRAGEVIGRAYGKTRRAGSSVGQFAGTHAMPLLMIGTGLAWLGMNIRKERRFDGPSDVDFVARRSMRPQVDPRSRYPEPRRPVYVEGTEGSKLLTVPVHTTRTTNV
ncbi:MAG: hypothetical protein ABW252_25430, partial [Polyangiales bacterium]